MKKLHLLLAVIMLSLLASVLPAEEVTVGTGNQQARIPLDFYWRSSLFETMYYPDELGFQSGTITQLKFYNDFVSNLTNKPVKIWLGSSYQANLLAGYIPSSQLTLVYDGMLSFPSGTNTLTLNLNTPFTHYYGNLVMMVQRPLDTVNASSSDFFKAQTVGTNRSRNAYHNTEAYDPAHPPQGSLSGQFPKASFVYTPISLVNDLACLSVSGNLMPGLGVPSAYTVTIRNNGSATQTNYQVKLMQEGGILLSTVNGTSIHSGESQHLTLSWTPQQVGPTYLYAMVDLAGDEVAQNNQSPNLNVDVQAATFSVTVGEGNQNARFPLDFFYKTSLYETIFYPDEIGMQGNIASLTLYNDFTDDLPNKQVKVWLGSTTLPNLSSGWVTASQLTPVFDGTVSFPVGQNSITIPLQTPYSYTGGNLVMMFFRPMDTGFFTTTDYFKCQTVGTNRARNKYSDTAAINPDSPGTGGTLSGQFPKTTFNMLPVSPNPFFTITPSSGDFGTVLLDSTHSRSYNVMNAGGGVLSIQNISITGSPFFALQNLPVLPAELGTGQMLSFVTNYHPTAAGTHTATVSITDNATNRIIHTLTLSAVCVDTNITSLPYMQNFDAVTAPALPLGWEALIQPASATAVVATNTSAPFSAPNTVRIYNGNTAGVDVMLVAPPLSTSFNISSTRVRLMAKGVASTYTLIVGVLVDPDDASTFTAVQTITTPTAWTEFTIPLTSYTGNGRYVAIKHGFGAVGQSVYVDDFFLELLTASDLAATGVTGNLNPSVGVASSYTASVYNLGTQAETNYTVKLVNGQGTELASAPGVVCAPGATVNVTLSWTPSTAGNVTLYAKVEHPLDNNPTNDQSPGLPVRVHPAGTLVVTVGQGNQTARMPLDFFFKNSLNQTLYFPAEIGSFGLITGIALHNNFASSNVTNKPLKIWMGTTSQESLVPGWIPATDMTLVFNGQISFPVGQNMVDIHFNTPFLYTGRNLVMMVQRPMDTVTYNASDFFKAQTIGNNRVRNANSDTVNFNPSSPGTVGTLGGQFAMTSFFFENQNLASLSGTVTSSGSPVAGVTISVANTSQTQQTNATGVYSFPYLLPGTYNVTAAKSGYVSQTQSVTLVANQPSTLNFNLTQLAVVTVSGTVVANDAPGVGVNGAQVVLSGQMQHNATTNAQGQFSITNVLAGATYQYTVSAAGFDVLNGTISVGSTNLNMGNLVLFEHVMPPRRVNASLNTAATQVNLAWAKPGVGNEESPAEDFEITNGGWVATSNWGNLLGDWEWSAAYDVGNFVDTFGSQAVVPPPTAHSGTGLWGTKLNTNYTNANGLSYLSKTVSFSGISNPQLSFWSWENVFGQYDYCQVTVNGMVVWGPTWQGANPHWSQRVIDLSAYANLHTVQIRFELFASSSVAYAGWYIDDVYLGAARGSENLAGIVAPRIGTLEQAQINFGEAQGENDLRTIHGYRVWRLTQGNEGNTNSWVSLTASNISDTTFVDPSWQSLGDGNHRWAVKAVYSNNQQSNAAFSNVLRILHNDLAALTISGNTTPTAGASYPYTVRIKNMGSSPQPGSSYTVKIMTGQTELASVPGVDIAPDAVLGITLNMVPSQVGSMAVYGKVVLSGDTVATNNNSPLLNLIVQPSDIVACLIGDGTTSARVPIDVASRNHMYEYLLYPADLNNTSGEITQISFFYNFTQNITDVPIKIWIGSTSLSNLASGWIPSTQLTLIYQGSPAFSVGEHRLNINLTTPYNYSADQNLVLLFNRPQEGRSYEVSNMFKSQIGTPANRSRNYASLIDPIDPANPSANAGIVSGLFPQTMITFTPSNVGQLSGIVTNANNQVLSGVQVSVLNTSFSTTTNAQGHYQFNRILPGNYTVRFSAFGYYDSTQPVTITAYEMSTCNVSMTSLPVISVSGMVIGNDTLAPIAGASVNLSGYHSYNTLTNVSGVFNIPGVYAGQTYTCIILAPGYAAHTTTIEAGQTNINLGTITLNELSFPPYAVQATVDSEDSSVSIIWNAPDPGSTSINQSFENETFPPQAWSRIITNNGPSNVAGVYPSWSRHAAINNMGEPIIPPDGSYQAGLRWDYDHQDEWLITSGFYCPPDAYLQFESQVFLGSIQGDHYYVKISSDNGLTWTVLWDASAQTGGWSYYVAPFMIDLGNYVGQQVKIAFHAEDGPDDGGLWYHWFIDDVSVNTRSQGRPTLVKQFGASDFASLSATAPNYQEYGVAETNASRAVHTGLVKTEPRLFANAAQRTEPQRVLNGYKVWRLIHGSETNEASWTLLTPQVITSLELSDPGWQNLPEGDFCWAVKAYYTNDVVSGAAFSNVLNRVIETGMIAGVVRAVGNAPVPGAIVSAAGRQAVTNGAGAYVLVLPVGIHEVMCQAAGYVTQTASNVIVRQGQTTTLNFIMTVDNDDPNTPALKTELYANYPNPFNPSTTIRYSLKDSGAVRLDIYNAKGQLVRRLVAADQSPGNYSVVFNGRDDAGRSVSSGMYLYRLSAGKQVFTRRMVLMQ